MALMLASRLASLICGEALLGGVLLGEGLDDAHAGDIFGQVADHRGHRGARGSRKAPRARRENQTVANTISGSTVKESSAR